MGYVVAAHVFFSFITCTCLHLRCLECGTVLGMIPVIIVCSSLIYLLLPVLCRGFTCKSSSARARTAVTEKSSVSCRCRRWLPSLNRLVYFLSLLLYVVRKRSPVHS